MANAVICIHGDSFDVKIVNSVDITCPSFFHDSFWVGIFVTEYIANIRGLRVPTSIVFSKSFEHFSMPTKKIFYLAEKYVFPLQIALEISKEWHFF